MILLRRALLSQTNYLRRSAALLRRDPISSSVSSAADISRAVPSSSEWVSTSQPNHFLFQSRRNFAKARKQVSEDMYENDYGAGNAPEVADIGPTVKASATSQMETAIEALSRDLTKLRTGRAAPGMLDHIVVEVRGSKMPLSRLAVVSVLNPKTLGISPYDPDTLKALEKAILNSPMGITPNIDGERLLAPIPPLTKEHMQVVCKVVAKAAEDVKQSIRRARQKALDTIKKSIPKKEKKDGKKDKAASGFSADDAKRLEKEIDDLTKKFIKSAEDLCKNKEKEINGS